MSPPSESQFSFSIDLSGEEKMSESDYPDFSKSFIIGSALFNILAGLKPRSISPRVPIVGEIQAEIMRRHEEHTQATPDQPIDEKQLYYDAAEECSKGRVYGLGSLAKMTRRYEDLAVWHVSRADGAEFRA
ncbi:hypothetical protein Syun_019233 [Stephania yunnanensis]|uniref:Uncharacterized protein n=1 Tax=Stephania yunnanensis TaxID=152371 RepID=A0AAP0NZ80_9MAGN